MHHPNLEKLKALKLFGMARALEDLNGLQDRGRLDFADQLALLIDREAADRDNIALAARLKRALSELWRHLRCIRWPTRTKSSVRCEEGAA